jgi:uncharacterized RDD family membrane protein YckC
MRDVYAVRAPENVVFELELAGLSARALAFSVDVLVMMLLFGLAALTCAVFGVVLAGFARALYFVALFMIQWGYGVVLEWRWRGQTVGKRVVGTRVVSSSGLPISFGQAALRNLLRIVDVVPGGYLLGALSILFDARARRLGDIAADTLVIRVQRTLHPFANAEAREHPRSLSQPEAFARAARSLSLPERDVMRRLAARREQLSPSVRYALFTKLAQHLEARSQLARAEFLSEERYVLNLAGVPSPPTAAKLRSEQT